MRGRHVALLSVMALLVACGLAKAALVTSDGATVHLSGALQLLHGSGNHRRPAGVSINAKLLEDTPRTVPQLSGIEIALSPRIVVDAKGLPLCRPEQIRNTSTTEAIQACGDTQAGKDAQLGRGELTRRMWDDHGEIELGAVEELVAFNGQYMGRPAILLHGSNESRIESQWVSELKLERTPGGAGYTLVGTIPKNRSQGGPYAEEFKWWISAFNLSLRRSFRFNGRTASFLTVSCPESRLTESPGFTLAQTTFDFGERAEVTGAVRGECGPS